MEPDNLVKFKPDEHPLEDMEFEGYYNRDSIKYIDIYGIHEAQTVLRGTYRYKVLKCGQGLTNGFVEIELKIGSNHFTKKMILYLRSYDGVV